MDQDAKMAAMDAAAVVADKELKKMSQHVTVPMARWWLAHFGQAGHKRLGRILVVHAKEMKGTRSEGWAEADESPYPGSEDSPD